MEYNNLPNVDNIQYIQYGRRSGPEELKKYWKHELMCLVCKQAFGSDMPHAVKICPTCEIFMELKEKEEKRKNATPRSR